MEAKFSVTPGLIAPIPQSSTQTDQPQLSDSSAHQVSVPLQNSNPDKLIAQKLRSQISIQRIQQNFDAMLEIALAEPQLGAPHVVDYASWNALRNYDQLRQRGDLQKEKYGAVIQRLEKIIFNNAAGENAHISTSQDAKLLHAVLTRPLDTNAPRLEKFLASHVFEALCQPGLKRDAPPDARTFNSILPSLMLASVDCNSIARTAFMQGALALIGESTEPHAKSDRIAKIKTTLFHFLKRPADGSPSMTMMDFCMEEPDPLDDLGCYEPVDIERMRNEAK